MNNTVRLSRASLAIPYPSDWQDGCTEPWIAGLLSSLLVASGGRRVLELGGFMGFTSVHLAAALVRMGGGQLLVAELDPIRAKWVDDRLVRLVLPGVITHRVFCDDAITVINAQDMMSLDFVFVDDDHTMEHVEAETAALLPKMRPGGLICYHDVYGSCNLAQVVRRYGGYSLDLARYGPAGGIGIIQV